MVRSHEFTIDLPGEGTYIIRLLEGVQIETLEGAAVGRWPYFDRHRRRAIHGPALPGHRGAARRRRSHRVHIRSGR
jgi:hypothetical protein